jgi:succinate dehydrogenase / fumarate reductase cytochrome b subunit
MPSPDLKPRPRSPHLQIYKPQLSSVLSITHRVTGVGLTLGLIVFVWWLAALAGGAESYATFIGYAQTILGQVILFGLSAAFLYHLCCGIRHLLWDAGYFLSIKDVYKTGKIMVATVLLLLLIVWLRAYGVSL